MSVRHGWAAWMFGIGLAIGCTPVEDDGLSGGDSGEADGGGGACVPGQSVGCACGDGSMGAQVCLEDGSGLGACMCDGSPGSDGGSDGGAGSGDGGPPPADDGGGPVIVSFSQDVIPIFEETCGASTMGCHEAAAFFATADADCRGWLSLENQPLGAIFVPADETMPPQETGCPDFSLHERLLDLGAWSCSPNPGDPNAGGGTIKRYVVPGNPDESYLLQRATGQATPCDLAPDVDMMPPVGSISDADLATIEQWIVQGALDN